MKKILLICTFSFTILSLIVYQSCKRDLTNEPALNSYKYDSLFVPIEIANIVAQNINKSEVVKKTVDKSLLKSTKYFGQRRIKNTSTISTTDKKATIFYVYNYELGGFTIISADKRFIPILAYSDNGSFKTDSLPGGFIDWMETTGHLIIQAQKSSVAQSSFVANQWASMQCTDPLLKSTMVAQYPPPPPPNGDVETSVTVTVGPLTNTTWDQDCFYNTNCPTLSDGPCGHAYTGCSTTAIAQVMAYWKYPANYNWSAMPAKIDYFNQSSLGALEVARLLGNIFPDVIKRDFWGNLGYNSGGSSCSNDYNITHCFLNSFNYSSASLAGSVNGLTYNGGKNNFQTVVSNLNLGEPVILGGFSSVDIFGFASGTGHTWVCDGYMQTTNYTNGVEQSQYLLYHMNWGWSGRYNGWCYFNNWTSGEGTYNYCTDIIYDIHP